MKLRKSSATSTCSFQSATKPATVSTATEVIVNVLRARWFRAATATCQGVAGARKRPSAGVTSSRRSVQGLGAAVGRTGVLVPVVCVVTRVEPGRQRLEIGLEAVAGLL